MILTVGKHEVEVFDSIQNMGILRLQKFNKYQMIASEIGNTFADYDARTEKVYKLLQKDMVAEAMQELNNRRQTVFNAFNEFTPTGKAMAILVKRIDKRVYKDYSPNALDEILARLEKIGFEYATAIQTMSDVKKK